MQLRWKSRLFVLLAVGILAFGMAGYSVKAADDTENETGSGTSEDTGTVENNDISGENFSVTWEEDKEYTYTGSAITPEVVVVKKQATNTSSASGADTDDQTGNMLQTEDEGGGENGSDGASEETTDVTLVKDQDYIVAYADNTNAGTATVTITGTGNYTGTVVKQFSIAKKDISDLQMEGKDKVYKGRALSADVNMYYNGVKLVRSEDYRIKDYVNNENVGTASATVKGKGNYTGERTMTFEITPKNIYELSYTPDLSENSYKYTGKKLTPEVTFTFDILGKNNKVTGQKILTKNVDYTINYVDNKKVGVATVMIIGKGNFTGSRIMSFKIRPQNTKVKKLVKGKKSIKVKWAKKDKQITGYIVMCSTTKDFSSNVKKVKVKKGTTKYTFKNLKSKKKYYVRVRTYKKAMGITYYSDWSNVMTIKTE